MYSAPLYPFDIVVVHVLEVHPADHHHFPGKFGKRPLGTVPHEGAQQFKEGPHVQPLGHPFLMHVLPEQGVDLDLAGELHLGPLRLLGELVEVPEQGLHIHKGCQGHHVVLVLNEHVGGNAAMGVRGERDLRLPDERGGQGRDRNDAGNGEPIALPNLTVGLDLEVLCEVWKGVPLFGQFVLVDPPGEGHRLEVDPSDHIRVLQRVSEYRPYLAVGDALDDDGH